MRLAALLFTAAAGACGGSVETGAGGSGATGSTTGNGTSGTSGTGGGSPSGCPVEAPTAAAACEKEALLCTYGEEPRPECRTSAICSGGTWIVNPPLCAQPPPGICPPAVPPNNEVCPSDGVVCTYADGTICGCTTCVAGPCMPPPPIWSCGPPPAGCPTIAPNAGTACAEEGQSCTYGNPCGLSGVVAFCTQGSWIWEIVPCPQ
jgi:hypothetical protein